MYSDMLFGKKVLFGFLLLLTDENKELMACFKFFYFLTFAYSKPGLYSIEIHLPVVGLSYLSGKIWFVYV